MIPAAITPSSVAPSTIATATAAATAHAPEMATLVLCVGTHAISASATAPSGSPGCSRPTGEMRIGAPLVSPQVPVVRGSSPRFSAWTPRRVLGPT